MEGKGARKERNKKDKNIIVYNKRQARMKNIRQTTEPTMPGAWPHLCLLCKSANPASQPRHVTKAIPSI